MKLREAYKTGLNFKRATDLLYRNKSTPMSQFLIDDLFADDWETQPPGS